jgi:lipopolysaccharide transport system ATP-binding protein
LPHHEKSERYTALRDVVSRQAKAAGRLLNPFTLAGQLRKAQREAAAERAESEEEFLTLKDVGFEISRGERVGIIGRNWTGEITLLKILSSITEPTTGRVEIRGWVASLLEVGTGFHPELTAESPGRLAGHKHHIWCNQPRNSSALERASPESKSTPARMNRSAI